MTYRIVRLSSGEEILCDLQVNGDFYLLKSPAIIIPTQDRNIGLAFWLPYAQSSVVQVSKKFVVFVVDPTPALLDTYNEMMSPIIVPPVKEVVST